MKLIKEPEDGLMLDGGKTQYCSDLRVIRDHKEMVYERSDVVHTFGYVIEGTAMLSLGGGVKVATLQGSGYFAVPGQFGVLVEHGVVALIRRYGYRGQLNMGAIEEKGRLTYIDGCSDSLICYPARMGDPTLNHLHFPAGIVQTQHTHPSIRLGIVARGGGHAWGPGWEEELAAGSVFMLAEHELHSFRTDKSNIEMDVIAFHPDSDFGPTDQAHPMLNRTYIGANPNVHATLIR